MPVFRSLTCLMLLCVMGSSLTGCNYFRARGNDALDTFDVGITVTTHLKPEIAAYIDFFNLTPIGYSSVNGKFLGMGNRQAGWLDYHSKDWAVLAYGREKHGIGWLNTSDPYQVRPDQKDVTERPAFTVGFVGAFASDSPPPKNAIH